MKNGVKNIQAVAYNGSSMVCTSQTGNYNVWGKKPIVGQTDCGICGQANKKMKMYFFMWAYDHLLKVAHRKMGKTLPEIDR